MGDVFDEDLMRELGLDPDEMEDVRKSLPQTGAKPPVHADAANVPAPQSRPVTATRTPVPGARPMQAAQPLAPTKAPPVVAVPQSSPASPAMQAEPIPKEPGKNTAVPRPAPADLGAYGEAMTQGISVHLAAVIAKKSIRLSDVIGMQLGEVIDFKKPPEEPIDLVVNGKLIAKAEMVLVDGRVGVRVVKLIR